MNNISNRLKSIPLWTAILSLIYLVLKSWFNIELSSWKEISAEIIAVLAIIFGVTNNPCDRDHF